MVADDVYITAGVLATVALFAVAVVVFIVYKKKTVPSAFSPNSMVRISAFFTNKKTFTASILRLIS